MVLTHFESQYVNHNVFLIQVEELKAEERRSFLPRLMQLAASDPVKLVRKAAKHALDSVTPEERLGVGMSASVAGALDSSARGETDDPTTDEHLLPPGELVKMATATDFHLRLSLAAMFSLLSTKEKEDGISYYRALLDDEYPQVRCDARPCPPMRCAFTC